MSFVRLLLVAILLGIGLNLTLTWTLALVIVPYPSLELTRWVPNPVPDHHIDGLIGPYRRSVAFGARSDHYAQTRAGTTFVVSELRWGWPFHCVRHAYEYSETLGTGQFGEITYTHGPVVTTTRHVELPWPPMRSLGNVLPVTPMLEPFVANTLCYSVLAFFALFLLPHVRRVYRRRRHRCPHCNYPAAHSSVCTECGEALDFDTKGETVPPN